MNFFILAAGFGERYTASVDRRLRLLGDKIGANVEAQRLYLEVRRALPKGLQTVGNRTVLDFMMDRVRSIEGVDVPRDVRIVTNGLHEAAFRDWAKRAGLADQNVVSDGRMTADTRLGALRDLQLLVDRFSIQDKTVILPSDSVFRIGFSLRDMIMRDAENLMAVTPVSESVITNHGHAILGPTGRIRSFVEKPEEPPELPEYLAAIALYVLGKKALSALAGYLRMPEAHPDAPGYFIEHLVKSGYPITAYRIPGRYDIGTIDGLEEAERHLRSEQRV